jgi:hypothetical protein
MKKPYIVAIMALAVLGSAFVPRASQAQITKTGNAYLFRMKYTKGAKYKFVLNSSVPVAKKPKATNLSVPYSMTVSNVTGNVGTLNMQVGPSRIGGKVVGPVQNVVVKLDTRGRIIGNNTNPSNISGIVFPDKPVKIGDTFPVNGNAATGAAGMTISGNYKFIGIKTVGGRQVAELAITLSGSGTASSQGSGTSFLDVADGQIVTATINQTITVQPQGGKAISMKNSVVISRK